MSDTYRVRINSVKEVHSLPDLWPPGKLRRILELAEFDDFAALPDADLLDMSLMALQDLERQQAGEVVLEAVFETGMRPGVRQNLVDDLEEDEPWNDIAELSHQRGVFETLVLLQQAYPNRYGTPDALQLTFSVSSPSKGIADLSPAKLLQIFSACLTDRDILNRLYGEDISAGRFNSAEHIIWWMEQNRSSESKVECSMIASKQWFHSIRSREDYSLKL